MDIIELNGKKYRLIDDDVDNLKVGDYVVRNERKGAPYAITNEDMLLGRVVETRYRETSDRNIVLEIINHRNEDVGGGYAVNSKYFRKATEGEIKRYGKKRETNNKFEVGECVRILENGRVVRVKSIDETALFPLELYDEENSNHLIYRYEDVERITSNNDKADKLDDESYNMSLKRWLDFREQQKNLYYEAINEISYAIDKTNTPSEYRERDLAEEITHILKDLDDKELALVINELEKREEAREWSKS